jgi:HlyD family secretion protein
LASADARLAAASAGVARDANGNRPQLVQEAEAGLASAEAALVESRRLHDRRRALLDKGFISRADYQSSEAGLAAATARADAARSALSLAREGTRAEDRAVTSANRDALVAERRAVTTDMTDTALVASEPGQVLTRAREVGSIVQPGETVLTVSLTQPVRVRAYVAEPDLPKIRPGMAVRVTVDGSDKTWPATISHISPTAEFTPKTVQTEQLRTDLVYRLRLVVTDPKGDLRQGQPVTVIVPAAPSGN